MIQTLTPPSLEDRFLPPHNWKIKTFTNPQTNHDIAYRTSLLPKAKGTIICLPGLSEFGEKYIETTHFFNQHGFNVIVIDWAYQGLSTRFSQNRHKRYSDGYDTDLSDLHHLITQEIDSALPLHMLVHSMGGHIGFRYVSKHPEIFQSVAASAPMFGIKALRHFPHILLKILSITDKFHSSYILGGHDWLPENRNSKIKNIFTHDPIRNEVHNAWNTSNENLRLGGLTYKWIVESLKSILILNKKENLEKITCLVLLTCADEEMLVDNKAIQRAARIIQKTKFIKFKNSKHEILMEKDKIRDVFLKEALDLFTSE